MSGEISYAVAATIGAETGASLGNAVILLVIGFFAQLALFAWKWYLETLAQRRQRRALDEQRQIIDAVKAELTKNSGSSVKDKTNSAAEDSKKTLDLLGTVQAAVGKIDGRGRRDAKRLNAALQKLGTVEEKIEATRQNVEALKVEHQSLGAKYLELKKEVDRFIVHEARKDLHSSELRKELEKKIGPPDAGTNPETTE